MSRLLQLAFLAAALVGLGTSAYSLGYTMGKDIALNEHAKGIVNVR